MTAFAYTT